MGIDFWIYDDRAQRARSAAFSWLTGMTLIVVSVMESRSNYEVGPLLFIPWGGALALYLGHGKTTIDSRGVLIEEGFKATKFVPLPEVQGFSVARKGRPHMIWLKRTNGPGVRVASVSILKFRGRRAATTARVEELNRVLEQARALARN